MFNIFCSTCWIRLSIKVFNMLNCLLVTYTVQELTAFIWTKQNVEGSQISEVETTARAHFQIFQGKDAAPLTAGIFASI